MYTEEVHLYSSSKKLVSVCLFILHISRLLPGTAFKENRNTLVAQYVTASSWPYPPAILEILTTEPLVLRM